MGARAPTMLTQVSDTFKVDHAMTQIAAETAIVAGARQAAQHFG